MNKISQLISLLGGTGAVAKKLKIQPSAISNWKKLNKIPSTKREAILELSSYLNVNIENFLPSEKLNNMKFKMLLIICGGIASYKSLEIIRLIKKTDIELDVVMTKSAQKFITPLLVTSLNEKKCYIDLFSVEDETKMNHINLARSPDLILVAPAIWNFTERKFFKSKFLGLISYFFPSLSINGKGWVKVKACDMEIFPSIKNKID